MIGVDFQQLDSDLEFPSFQSLLQFNITILDNDIAEVSSEGFTVSLTSSPSDDIAVVISESARTTVVTIKEDDSKYMCLLYWLKMHIIFIDVLILMDLTNPILIGREGGTDLQIRLYKAGNTVAVVSVDILLFVDETLCKLDFLFYCI